MNSDLTLHYAQEGLKKVYKVKTRTDCRLCGSTNLSLMIDLGVMPLAGGFLLKSQVPKEQLWPLRVFYCADCSLVQVLDVIPPEKLFEQYFYLSSVTQTLSSHFVGLANVLCERFSLGPSSLVVDIGSNDGVLLRPLVKRGIRAVGVEPSKNVSSVARKAGLEVVNDYFREETAVTIRATHGPADVINASNVFAHIDNVHDVVLGILRLLKPAGTFVCEVHYVYDLLDLLQYDTIYHEHLCYYSVTALESFFDRYGMEIYAVERIPMHAGAIRIFVRRKASGNPRPEASVASLIAQEHRTGVKDGRTYARFRENTQRHRQEVADLLASLRERNKSIVGYGAPGRGTIFLNYCRIGPEILDYVVDASPLKQGKLVPGMHVPIYSPSRIMEHLPDYLLLIAWNYKKEIVSRESTYLARGGKFILPFPRPSIERETPSQCEESNPSR